MSAGLKILVVGGYGVFGGRLVDLLRDDARLTLFVAGRSLRKAEAFCSRRGDSGALLLPTRFDRKGDLAAQLATVAPDLCVDASGPFQHYDVDGYALVRACICAGVHYLDLADASAFVMGIQQFDGAARDAGVYVLSGVSSFPVLTAAVTRRLAGGLASVTSITGGIAPSPYAGVGENVIRAIASYAGQPIAIRRGGGLRIAHPFTETKRFVVAPPGVMPLRRTLFSLVDVPDLQALALLWPGASAVWMGAGPVPAILHRALLGLSWFVRWRLVRSLSPLAGLIHRVTNRVRWGPHRGGMFVELVGSSSSNQEVRRSWHLLAEGDDGPLIPCMAVQAVVRRVQCDKPPAPGARAAVEEVELEDYDALFAGRAIYTGVREDTPAWRAQRSLYERVMGPAWERLPPAIREIHDGRGKVAQGRASVRRGTGLLSSIVAALFRFPRAGDDFPVIVKFNADACTETWVRSFGGRGFSSKLKEGRGAAERLLCESLGPFTFAQALVVEGEGLRLVMRRWTVFGIPMPLWLGPRSNSRETAHDGRYCFSIELTHPLTGLIVKYEGWLGLH
jgi:hypothetical protein